MGNGGGREGSETTCLHITSEVVCQSSNVKRTATSLVNAILRTRIDPRNIGGRDLEINAVSKCTFTYRGGSGLGTGDDLMVSSSKIGSASLLVLETMFGKG